MYLLIAQTEREIYKITASLEDIVLCLRILKLHQYIKFFFYYFKNEEQHSSRVIEINEIKLEFIDSVLFFISYLFISASIILSLDHIFDFALFAPFTPENRLSWHNALYYQLVTMTGIGYGDISPKTSSSRIVSAVLIFYLTLHFTYFVTILISLMIKNKSVNKYLPLQKGWNNHIIIIGNLLCSESLTENFLRNHYSLLYKSQTKKFKSRMVFIYHKEPLQPLNNYLSYELVNEHYTLKKIRFIQNSLNDQSWMKDANLPAAKYLVCFFVTNRKGISDEEYEKIGKGILSSVAFAKSFYPKLQIFISLDSEPLLKEMKVYEGDRFHNSLSFYRLKRRLLALEVENPGASAVISVIANGVHSIDRDETLYFLKKKITDEKVKTKLMNYIEGTFSRIIFMEVPNILVGLGYNIVSMFLYYLDFCMISTENRIGYNENFNYRAILIGVKPHKKSQILLNPINYNFSSKDRLYLIVNHESVIDKIRALGQEQLIAFSKFKEVFLEKDILREAQTIIEETLEKNKNNYMEKFENNRPRRYFERKHCYNINKEVDLNIKEYTESIVIIGSDVDQLYGLIKKINSLSKRIIFILGAEKIRDHELWERVLKKRFSNVFYLYGDFLNCASMEKINIKKAHKVFILSEQKLGVFIDFNAIQISRFFSENFPDVETFIELIGDKSLTFLDLKPYQKELPEHFYPLNLMGKVLLSQSVFCSLTASCFYKIGDIVLNLLAPSKYLSKCNVKCNPSIGTLVINEKIVSFLKNFGRLNFALMQMTFPVTAIALMKSGKKINKCKEKLDVFSWQHDVLIVMPPITMELEVGDKVIMIGNEKGEILNYNEKQTKVFKTMGIFSLLNVELEQKKWRGRLEIKEGITNVLKDYIELMRKIDLFSTR